ncbi:hypothetical protein [Candidatus Pelagibacter sp. HIMB1746]|uniref:hypothetical protein n=1 Tax=Candidatus Pelagibacter sp. HIMB1746 TaxID=3413370 RepID=UPI003F85B3BE
MIKIFKNIIMWGICFTLLAHNSACVSIATGALDGAIEKQERTNRINTTSKALGFDQREFNDYHSKLTRAYECMEKVDASPKYYSLFLKSPENKSYKNYSDKSFITNNERVALSSYVSSTEICYDLARQDRYQSPLVVEFKTIIDRAVTQMLIIYSRLDNGEINWGEFNRQAVEISNQTDRQTDLWNSKMQSTSYQVANLVALQEEQIALNRYRQDIKNEFRKNRQELQAMRNDIRRMNNRNRLLEMCSRYPGTYMNCP